MKIGVQLYTLRTSFEKDMWGTFDALAAQGFKNVELAGTYGLEPSELAEGLAKRGLKASSSHMGLDQFGDLDKVIEFAKVFGISDLIVPWLAPEARNDWPGLGKRLMEISGALAPHGLKVGYHNHDFEFEPSGDSTGYEELWDHADTKKVFAEIDIYWVVKAKQDPVEWLGRLSGSVPFTHFKDMKKDSEFFAEVGSGRFDWKSIIEAGKKAGVKHAIIEHDQPEIDPLESVKRSREYLLSLGLRD